MDYWQTFELSPKTLRHLVENSTVIKRILDDKEKCNLFLNRFPYDQLLNFTTVEGPFVMMCVRLLELFVNCEDFYGYDERINYALEYILINLSHVTRDGKETLFLLRLLSKLLYRNNSCMDHSFRNIFDKERIMEVLLKLTKLKSIQKSNFAFYAAILTRLLDPNFSDSLNHLLSALFDVFQKYELRTEQIVVCKLILASSSKILKTAFKNVWDWLIWECPTLLSKSVDLNVLEDIIHCLTTSMDIWLREKNTQDNPSISWKQINKLFQNLYKVTSDICLHSAKIRLKFSCYKLLKYVLFKFLTGDMIFSVTDGNLCDFDKLPEDVESWPKSDNDIFFCICHICVDNSRLIWKQEDVFHAIMRCFYNRRHFVKTFVLKSIYYLYPKLMNKTIDVSTRTLGDDLLNYFEKLCSASYLYSYNSHQLKWVLDQASKSVKLTVLTQWMYAMEYNESLEDILISTIKSCNSEVYLLQLMMSNNTSGNIIGLKSMMLLRKITCSEVSRFITCLLPLTILEKPGSFHNLLLAKPGITLNSRHSALICSLMGAILPNLTDTSVLKSACIFSSKLLLSKKMESYAIRGFCRNVTNIRQIIDKTNHVDDETGVEIIKLLKAIVVVQKRNNVQLEYYLKEDFRNFVKGSVEKINRSLWLLYYTMIYKYSIIIPDESCVLDIYHLLLDHSLNSALQDVAFRCLIVLLKRKPWLAQTISSAVFVETVCLSLTNDTFKANVFKMLNIWLQLIRKEPYNGFCAIPETAIRSFVMRNGAINQNKEEYFVILDDLTKKQNYEVESNSCSAKFASFK